MTEYQSMAEYISANCEIPDLRPRLSVTRIQNTRAETLELWLEPWGARLLVLPNTYYDIVTLGRARESPSGLWQGDVPTVEIHDSHAVMFVETVVEKIAIFHEGKLLASY